MVSTRYARGGRVIGGRSCRSPYHPITPSPHHPRHDHDSPSPDILVVGAGPTGLTLAVELARRGVPFRIIDRETERTKTSRAIGTQARTVEVFRVMGIPETALEPSARPRALRFAERDRTLARISFDDDLPGASRLISMDESDTERVLEQRLEQLGGRVERSTQLLGFRVDGDRVTATLQGPGRHVGDRNEVPGRRRWRA